MVIPPRQSRWAWHRRMDDAESSSFVGKVENAAGAPMVRVNFLGRPVLLPSPVQIDLADGVKLGTDSVVESFTTAEVQSEFRQHPGKRSRVVDRCREVVIHLRERAVPSRRWEIVLACL